MVLAILQTAEGRATHSGVIFLLFRGSDGRRANSDAHVSGWTLATEKGRVRDKPRLFSILILSAIGMASGSGYIGRIDVRRTES